MEKQSAKTLSVVGLVAAAALGATVPASAQVPYYGAQAQAEYSQTYRAPRNAREHQYFHRYNIPHRITRFDQRRSDFRYDHRAWDDRYRQRTQHYQYRYNQGQHERYEGSYQVESNNRISGAVFGALAGALIGYIVTDDGDQRQYYQDRNTNRYYYYSNRDRNYYWDHNYRR